jgi:hypothetical protein
MTARVIQDRDKPYPNKTNIGQVQFPKAGAVLACLGEACQAAPAFKLIPTLNQAFPQSPGTAIMLK